MLLALGDTHSLKSLKYLIKDVPVDSVIIGVGDHNEGYISAKGEQIHYLNKLHDHLVKKNQFLYLVRGNHACPAWHKPDHLHNQTYTNLKFVEDYTYLEYKDKTILMVGGAISVDRWDREFLKDWWPDEEFVYDESKIQDRPVDILITHSSGIKFPPYGPSNFVAAMAIEEADRLGKPSTMLEEVAQERRDIQKLVEKVNPKKYIFGHFHAHHMGTWGEIFFRCLDIDELVQIG